MMELRLACRLVYITLSWLFQSYIKRFLGRFVFLIFDLDFLFSILRTHILKKRFKLKWHTLFMSNNILLISTVIIGQIGKYEYYRETNQYPLSKQAVRVGRNILPLNRRKPTETYIARPRGGSTICLNWLGWGEKGEGREINKQCGNKHWGETCSSRARHTCSEVKGDGTDGGKASSVNKYYLFQQFLCSDASVFSLSHTVRVRGLSIN